MAVFPDKIVLKNSADTQAVIQAAIANGGTDAITAGELVIGRESGSIRLYSVDSNGDIKSIAAGSSTLAELTDTTIASPSNGQALVYNGTAWVNGAVSSVGSIDDLSDVDTTTAAPSIGQVLEWNGTNWVPGTASAAGSIDDLSDVDTTTAIPSVGQVLEWDGTNWVPATVSSGGGINAIAGTVIQKTESQTAASGEATFVELGASGTLVSVTSSLDAWIVLYPTAADRTADAARVFGDDPLPGSGVLAEFYITAAGTILASPGTTYFNNDTTPADALYVAVRDQAGASVNAEVTIKAYVHQNFAGVGTNRVSDSGVASSGALDLTGMGQSGQLCTVTSDLDAWIVLYGSDADRTADASRNYGTDPLPGSGVQAEFYITAGSTVVVTPGSVYYNNDTSPADAMYLAVRSQAKAPVNATVTITAYAETSFTGVSGGTFGSG